MLNIIIIIVVLINIIVSSMRQEPRWGPSLQLLNGYCRQKAVTVVVRTKGSEPWTTDTSGI